MKKRRSTAGVALWGGVECTINRVGDTYFDQLALTGHAERIGDLDLFADLGLHTLRYPLLWERIAPNGLDKADWTWADARMKRLRELDIDPIVGLLHHGSGPLETSLIDPEFPELFAEYARAVAERYPWVSRFTPINEPLTTARFSGLYGHWYPHSRDSLIFARILLNECRAIALAMAAIREVNPAAQLVQTEDMGKVYGTPRLKYQADFENERRWLSFDLLCGRVQDGHPMHHYLRWLGIREDELVPFVERPCPPDILGINYYITSERFLDERVELYMPAETAGNGRDRYADVEAVRVLAEGIAGPERILREIWERYHIPIAVTEAHLSCSTDEQMRWLQEIWDVAHELRRDGIGVVAITAWSLLGAYDWNTLVTQAGGHYEPGAFEVRHTVVQPTALAAMLRSLLSHGYHSDPALRHPGWWRKPERFRYTPWSCAGEDAAEPVHMAAHSPSSEHELLAHEAA